MKKNLIKTLLLFITFSAQIAIAKNQVSEQFFSQFVELDRLIFEESFNQCHTEVLPPIITTDFEFYHDVGGVQNKAEFLQAVKDNICSNPNNKPIRKLVPNSMEVFSLKQDGVIYGAIQRGVHEFYIKEKGKKLYKTGIAKFTHLWLLSNEKWQLKRVLSFDHQPASE